MFRHIVSALSPETEVRSLQASLLRSSTRRRPPTLTRQMCYPIFTASGGQGLQRCAGSGCDPVGPFARVKEVSSQSCFVLSLRAGATSEPYRTNQSCVSDGPAVAGKPPRHPFALGTAAINVIFVHTTSGITIRQGKTGESRKTPLKSQARPIARFPAACIWPWPAKSDISRNHSRARPTILVDTAIRFPQP
jgi:hypothetical protein